MKKIEITVPDNLTSEQVKEVIDELCKNGVAKGCYQDYGVLAEVLQIFSEVVCALKEKK